MLFMLLVMALSLDLIQFSNIFRGLDPRKLNFRILMSVIHLHSIPCHVTLILCGLFIESRIRTYMYHIAFQRKKFM